MTKNMKEMKHKWKKIETKCPPKEKGGKPVNIIFKSKKKQNNKRKRRKSLPYLNFYWNGTWLKKKQEVSKRTRERTKEKQKKKERKLTKILITL